MAYTLTVNGRTTTADVSADTPLLWVIRDTLKLKGTKFGCGIGQCGACTVHVERHAYPLVQPAGVRGRRPEGDNDRGAVGRWQPSAAESLDGH